MKILLTTICLLLLFVSGALAETRYISDMLVVTVRAQPGNGEKILATALTGEPLEILEEGKEYLLVRTQKGVEGYVRSQYVTKETPKLAQINQLKKQNRQLQEQLSQQKAKANKAAETSSALSDAAKDLEALQAEYNQLKQASANVLQITRERDQLQQENSDLASSMQQLKEENSLYLRTGVIKWFLAGAGVLFFGWVLGKLSRKKKRNYL